MGHKGHESLAGANVRAMMILTYQWVVKCQFHVGRDHRGRSGLEVRDQTIGRHLRHPIQVHGPTNIVFCALHQCRLGGRWAWCKHVDVWGWWGWWGGQVNNDVCRSIHYCMKGRTNCWGRA